MPNTIALNNAKDAPQIYRITLKGHLGPQWADWFEGMTITLENGNTLLTGPVADQAALHGLLKKVRDLGLPLISVNRIERGRADQPNEGELDGKGGNGR